MAGELGTGGKQMNYSRLDCRHNESGVILYYGGGDTEKKAHIYRNLQENIVIYIPFDFSLTDEQRHDLPSKNDLPAV